MVFPIVSVCVKKHSKRDNFVMQCSSITPKRFILYNNLLSLHHPLALHYHFHNPLPLEITPPSDSQTRWCNLRSKGVMKRGSVRLKADQSRLCGELDYVSQKTNILVVL